MALQLDDDGWTLFPLHSGARRIYVSAAGNDSNDGLSESTPKLTVAAGKALIRVGTGDHLLFRRGDTWENQPLGGRNNGSGVKLTGHSEDYPIVIGAYGDESLPRPQFRLYGNTFTAFSGGDGSGTGYHWAFVSLDFIGRYDGATTELLNAISIVGIMQDITVEDCRMRWFETGVAMSGIGADYVTNVRIRRSCAYKQYATVVSTSSAGFFLSRCNGVLYEDNILWHNGWTGDGRPSENGENLYRHGLYLQNDCIGTLTVRNNWSLEPSAQGLSLRSPTQCTWNAIWRAPTGITFRPGTAGSGSFARENVLIDGRTTSYIDGADAWALNMDGASVSGWVVERNIVANWEQGTRAVVAMRFDSVTAAGDVQDNICYDFPAVTPSGSSAGVITFRRNHLQLISKTGRLVNMLALPANSIFAHSNNKYHKTLEAANTWFSHFLDINRTFAQYVSDIPDATSVSEQVSYPDPGRDYADYWQHLGETGGMPELIAALIEQRKGAWDTRLEAKRAIHWIGQGYGILIGEGLPSGGDGRGRRARATISAGVGI